MGQISDKFSNFKLNATTIILIVSFSAFSFLIMPLSEAFIKEPFVGIQFLFIGLISIIALFVENQNHSFSTTMSVYFFCYLFFYCAALFQFSSNTFRWFLYPSIDEVIKANNLILIGMISFILGNHFYIRITGEKHITNIKEKRVKRVKIRKWVVCIFLIILTSYFLYLLTIMPITSFLVRETFQIYDRDNQSLGLILTSFRNGIALISSLMSIELYKKEKSGINLLIMIYSLLLVLFIIPPTGVARFLAGAFYGSIVLYSFSSLRNGRKFLLVMFLFILMVFPLLNNFRYADGNILNFFDIINGLSNNFQSADFDAYTMLVYTVQYVSSLGYSLGYQLLGTILFFIPRTIWPSKPVGSGSEIVQSLFVPVNSNLSCPFVAEYYINFGVFGVIIFSLLLGCLLNTIDKMYWREQKEISFLKFFYPFLSLMTIYCCRGDMLSSCSFLTGTCLSSYICYKMAVKKSSF